MARDSSPALHPVPFFLLLLLLAAGCGGASPSESSAAIRFNPCEPLALVLDVSATPDETSGALAAIGLWNAAAGARLSAGAPDPAGTALPVTFQAAAAPSHGFYDPTGGEVFVNRDLAGRPLLVTIAHEVGHAFGLVHVTGRPSVMNAGNLDVEPNADDVTTLATLWGSCEAAQGIPDR